MSEGRNIHSIELCIGVIVVKRYTIYKDDIDCLEDIV